jgi:hypothetical protein
MSGLDSKSHDVRDRREHADDEREAGLDAREKHLESREEALADRGQREEQVLADADERSMKPTPETRRPTGVTWPQASTSFSRIRLIRTLSGHEGPPRWTGPMPGPTEPQRRLTGRISLTMTHE